MIAKKSPELEQAVNYVLELSQDEKVRMQEEYFEKVRRDEASRMNAALENAKAETVRKAFQMGLSMKHIIELTGLPRERIRAIIKSN